MLSASTTTGGGGALTRSHQRCGGGQFERAFLPRGLPAHSRIITQKNTQQRSTSDRHHHHHHHLPTNRPPHSSAERTEKANTTRTPIPQFEAIFRNVTHRRRRTVAHPSWLLSVPPPDDNWACARCCCYVVLRVLGLCGLYF